MNLYERWRHLRRLPPSAASPRKRRRRRLTALTAGVAVVTVVAAMLAVAELSSPPKAAADSNPGLQAAGLAVARAIQANPSIVTEMAAAAHADQPWAKAPSKASLLTPAATSSCTATYGPADAAEPSASPCPSASASDSASPSPSDSPSCDDSDSPGDDDPSASPCPSDSDSGSPSPSDSPSCDDSDGPGDGAIHPVDDDPSASPCPSDSDSGSPSPSDSPSCDDSDGPGDGAIRPADDDPSDSPCPSPSDSDSASPSPSDSPSDSDSPSESPSESPSDSPSDSPSCDDSDGPGDGGDTAINPADGDPSDSPCPSPSDSPSCDDSDSPGDGGDAAINPADEDPSDTPCASPSDSPSCDDSDSPGDGGDAAVNPADDDPSDTPCASPSDSPSCDDSDGPGDGGDTAINPADDDPSDSPCPSPSDSPTCDDNDPTDPCTSPTPGPPDECLTSDPAVKSKINREILYDRDEDGDNGCWSLIASGDSVTSAHYMAASAAPINLNCPGTPPSPSGDGNDYVYSWAGAAGTDWSSTKGVFTGDPLFAGGDYYNFARVGFDTTQMLTVTGKDPDSCGNPWDRTLRAHKLAKYTPFQLIVMAAKYEITKKERKVAWVTTGGVNDTNWLSARAAGQAPDWFGGVLLPYSACEVLANAALANWFMRHGSWFTVRPTDMVPFTFEQGNPNNDRYMQALLQEGGTCSLQVDHLRPVRFTVPKFNIATSGPVIAGNISAMVRDGLQAGINKIIWVGYYDMTWAQVDIRGLLQAMVRNETVVNYIMGNAGLPQAMSIFSNRATPVVQGFLTQLDDKICEGVESGKKAAGDVKGTATCTRWQDAGFNSANDMQTTVVGGMPHPSLQGMAKLATMVEQVLHQ